MLQCTHMVISYGGFLFVKIAFGDRTVVFNPPSGSKFASDVALISSGKSDYSKAGVLIDGPGEYERDGLYIKGVGVTRSGGKQNTIYAIVIEGVSVCHLGALDHPNIGAETIEALGDINILFVPVGGETMTPSEASKLSSELEPNVVIPISGGDDWQKVVKSFLKEEGEEKTEFQEKLTIRRKEVEGKEGEVFLIEPCLS